MTRSAVVAWKRCSSTARYTSSPTSIRPRPTEWLESLDAVVDSRGKARAHYLLARLMERARDKGVGVPSMVQTDYINTIPREQEPWFPGDEYVERRIRAFIRWNAVIMVDRANHRFDGLGGHLSTYASAAALYEVGFNHFFRGKSDGGYGDQVFFQGHAAPGIYALRSSRAACRRTNSTISGVIPAGPFTTNAESSRTELDSRMPRYVSRPGLAPGQKLHPTFNSLYFEGIPLVPPGNPPNVKDMWEQQLPSAAPHPLKFPLVVVEKIGRMRIGGTGPGEDWPNVKPVDGV